MAATTQVRLLVWSWLILLLFACTVQYNTRTRPCTPAMVAISLGCSRQGSVFVPRLCFSMNYIRPCLSLAKGFLGVQPGTRVNGTLVHTHTCGLAHAVRLGAGAHSTSLLGLLVTLGAIAPLTTSSSG